jgi:hypothetical protein
METKHTPGPWKAQKDFYDLWAVFADGHIENGFKNPWICQVWDDFTSKEQAEANAKLIAALPDLLEAVALYLCDVENEMLEYNDDTYRTAKEAIRKATE